MNIFYEGILIDTIYEYDESLGILYYIDEFYENVFQPFFDLKILDIDECYIYIPENTPTIQFGYTFDTTKYRVPYHPSLSFYNYFRIFSVLDTQVIYNEKYEIYPGTLIECNLDNTFTVINSTG